MPPRRSSPKPAPKVMTWPKASLALSAALIFDALRFMFDWFVLFGPALAATYCASELGGGAVATGFCALTAGAAGAALSGPIIAFGIVMAMAVGFAGWIALGILMFATNPRIFKDNSLWFVGSLVVSEVPFINTLPVFTATTWRAYSRQIKEDKAAYAKWKRDNAAAQLAEQQQQAGQIRTTQMQQIQKMQIVRAQEAANEAQFVQKETPNAESEAA